jgi:hypothetical protein
LVASRDTVGELACWLGVEMIIFWEGVSAGTSTVAFEE